MWKARYWNKKTGAEYWRTVYGDTVNEATKIANRYARKGFICAGLTDGGKL